MEETQEPALPSIFFPEKMNNIELIVPIQSAYALIKNLADQGHVEIIDSNSGNQTSTKRHAETFMECEEVDRSVRYLQYVLTLYGKLPPRPLVSEYYADINRFNEMSRFEVFSTIKDYDHQVHEKLSLYRKLIQQKKNTSIRLEALKFYISINNFESSDLISENSQTMLVDLPGKQVIYSVTGFVDKTKVHSLIMSAVRATRRNTLFQTGPAVDNLVPYALFVSSPEMHQLLLKLCESFDKNVFSFSSDYEQLISLQTQLETNLSQMEEISSQTNLMNQRFLDEIAENFWSWNFFVSREKLIWMEMDYGDYEQDESTVHYFGWTPVRFTNELSSILNKATEESGSGIPIQLNIKSAEECMELNPPTFIETNNFAYPFQMLNDAYGIPDYNEINGGAFYAMYPFLFAIMFGDMGHSIFYLLLTLVVFLLENNMRKKGRVPEMYEIIFKFKWLLFFASVCSFYCGFLYNDIFGLPLNLFKSGWIKNTSRSTTSTEYWDRDPSLHVYPFGIDYNWLHKDNELIFLNSYKMKLSIVMGMTQMVFGMILQLINHIRRKDVIHLVLCWIPEILYLIPFFGYMVVIILKKWLTNFSENKEGIFPLEQQQNGVNLIQMMISMVLNFGSKPADLYLYKNQWNIQLAITIIFFISIPCLLFCKPIYDFVKHHREPNFSVLEIFVMNLIHVIEFCLSALSHLASYLRLWALSLAHSQLSHVLWDELFLLEMNMKSSANFVILFVSFAGFAVMTVAILLGMEAFSALLHGIRLMWVEFSSKFYNGMGIPFKPLSLKDVLNNNSGF